MITIKVSSLAVAAGLLAAVSAAPTLAEQSSTPNEALQKVAVAKGAREIPLGLLIKTPDIPHGVSFSRQIA